MRHLCPVSLLLLLSQPSWAAPKRCGPNWMPGDATCCNDSCGTWVATGDGCTLLHCGWEPRMAGQWEAVLPSGLTEPFTVTQAVVGGVGGSEGVAGTLDGRVRVSDSFALGVHGGLEAEPNGRGELILNLPTHTPRAQLALFGGGGWTGEPWAGGGASLVAGLGWVGVYGSGRLEQRASGSTWLDSGAGLSIGSGAWRVSAGGRLQLEDGALRPEVEGLFSWVGRRWLTAADVRLGDDAWQVGVRVGAWIRPER